MSKGLVGICLTGMLFWGMTLLGQSGDWWAQNVGWDGVRPYQYYLNLTPAGMGPNALPVPSMHKMNTDSSSWFSVGAWGHFHEEEETVSARLGMQWSPAPWCRLVVQVIPLEGYRTSHALKTERKIFFEAYHDRFAGGDFHIETLFRLPPRWLGGWESSLRVGIRAPSGTHLGAARYTDTPGYWFDLAFTRRLTGRHVLEVQGGFLVYQTYDDQLRQNDCLLWGLGHRWTGKRFEFFHSLRGYSGYLGNGDSPIVYEAECLYRSSATWSWVLTVGKGIHDYPFVFTGLTGRWHFSLPIRQR